ncbi:MAG: ankyrin repeat domain-containing protein [Synechococcus sp. SB0668_bin_13]|nr:ankyrin repeat domain-containing protein [Synechococcus sp. SB0668_bin_13]
MQLLRKAFPHHTAGGRYRRGGILALLAAGVAALAVGAAVIRPDCADWNTREFFEEVTADDVARCLSQGADPRAGDKDRNTPLHLAAKHSDSPEAVKVLVDAGADLEARNKDGFTPLHLAIVSYMHNWRNIETDRSLRRPPPSSGIAFLYPYNTGATSYGRELWRLGEDEWEWRPLDPTIAPGTHVPFTQAFQQTPQSPAQPQVAPTELDEISVVVKALLDAGADPTAKTEGGVLPVDLIDEFTPSDSPLRGTDVYWRLNEARF